MEVTMLFSGVIIALLVVEGIYQIATGKTIDSAQSTREYSKTYTKESLMKYNRCTGVFVLLIGLIYLVFKLGRMGFIPFETPFWVLMIIIVILVAVIYLSKDKILVKKDK